LGRLEEFRVTSEQFFKFLAAVSSRYTGTSYHNWSHACDVTQCIYFMVTHGGILERYQSWEIFTLLLSAICHDTNHEGLNNTFMLKAETPLGILFKNQSVMEMHHLTESIPILSRPDIDLFKALDSSGRKRAWSLFIQIILSTDMARHSEVVKGAQAVLDEGTFDLGNEEHRLLGLELLIKVADISNVSRPFEIADKWCNILNVEFWRQGDLEKEEGIGLTSPLNDRESSNKPKSQIGFYTFVCIPLYTVVARVFPPLQENLEAVKSNLERWKALAESS
jgi:hypothetical protein